MNANFTESECEFRFVILSRKETKMKKRIVSLLLAALMLATTFIFAACGDNGDTPATTPAVTDGADTPGDTTVPEDTTAGLAIPDEDLEEYEFMVYEVYLDNNFSSGDFTYSEGSGTVLDEAKYKRNSLVEEKFNIVMSSEIVKGTSTTGSNEGYGKMLQAKNAGDPTYDVVVLPAYDQTKLAQNGGLYDMYAVPHLDLTSAYWDQNAVKDLTIKDTLFFLTGDFSIESAGFLIENGKIGAPIKSFTVAGNFFELLKQISAIDNVLEMKSPGFSQIGSPDVLVPDMSVAGEELQPLQRAIRESPLQLS